MADWTSAYRSGHKLLIPVKLNGGVPRLFLLDTGSPGAVLLASNAAQEVTSLSHSEKSFVGANGKVATVEDAASIELDFAGLRQEFRNVPALDLGKEAMADGSQVSGILGFDLLRRLIVSFDYRDDLVRFSVKQDMGR
jgi:predicted aspartyl protease